MIIIFIGVCIGISRDCSSISQDRRQRRRSRRDIRRRQIQMKFDSPRSQSDSQYRELQLAMCPECEATILAETNVCPHCGAPQPVCIVCQNSVVPIDSTLSCPHCRGRAHRIHFLEYLKVKGICPQCKVDLDPHELIDDSYQETATPSASGPQHLCMVCNRALGSTDLILQCPKCEGRAHRIHFLEYLKVKGKCPHCNTDLDPPDLIET
jgi:hypothetical protein